MKKGKLLLLFLLVAGIFVSCSDKDDPVVIEYEAKMLTFGFHAEDNPGIIFQDYLVETVAGTTIQFLMPEETDKSKLIARFTTTANDKVMVNAVTQQSGTTVNDFTVPLDYIVSEETANVKYTVTIGKAPAFVWQALPPFATDEAKSVSMKVNPKNGNPYFLYKPKRATSAEEGAILLNFKDGAWGTPSQVSDGQVGLYTDFTFNSEGIPYVSYTDYTTDVNNFLTVKKQTGSTWSLVGGKGFSSGRYTYNSLAFVNDDKLMLAGTYSFAGILAKRELSINFFENNAWTLDNTIPGRAATLSAYLMVSIKKGNAVYVGVYNPIEPNTVSVHKYANNTWETVIDQWTDPAATGISLRDIDIAVDSDGNIFVAISEIIKGVSEKHRVIKYVAATKEIESVGNPIEAAKASYVNFDMALSPFGVPFLLYRNENNFPTVVHIEKDSQDWSTPKVLEQADANELSIDFAADGVGYLSYLKDNVIVAHKYAAPL